MDIMTNNKCNLLFLTNHHLKMCTRCNRVIRCNKKNNNNETAHNSKPEMKNTNAGCIRTLGVLVPWSLHLWLCSPMVTHFNILQQPTDQWNFHTVAKSLGDIKKSHLMLKPDGARKEGEQRDEICGVTQTHTKKRSTQHITASLSLFLFSNM